MRRGVSLIEMIVVMTVGAVLMGVAVSLLLVLLRTEQGGRTHAQRNESLQRLADQFRRDVHAADKTPKVVDVRDEAGFVTLLMISGDRILFYDAAHESPGIVRREINANSGGELSRETYLLPEDSAAAFAVIDPDAGHPIVRLTIAPEDESLRAAQEICIEAAASRDGRFLKPKTAKPATEKQPAEKKK